MEEFLLFNVASVCVTVKQKNIRNCVIALRALLLLPSLSWAARSPAPRISPGPMAAASMRHQQGWDPAPHSPALSATGPTKPGLAVAISWPGPVSWLLSPCRKPSWSAGSCWPTLPCWIGWLWFFVFFFLFEYKKAYMIYVGGVVESVLIQILVTYWM